MARFLVNTFHVQVKPTAKVHTELTGNPPEHVKMENGYYLWADMPDNNDIVYFWTQMNRCGSQRMTYDSC